MRRAIEIVGLFTDPQQVALDSAERIDQILFNQSKNSTTDKKMQRELEREPVLWKDAESATAVMISKIKIEQQDKLYSIVKTPGGAQMLSDIKYAMIDYSKMKSDEDVPVGPVVKDDWIIWYSNAMAIGIRFTDPMYKPQLETLRLLSGVDFNWREIPAYQIQR